MTELFCASLHTDSSATEPIKPRKPLKPCLPPVQVRHLQENAAQLRTIYAGEKAEAIMVKEQEVMEAWKELLSSCEASRVQVTSVTDKVQFFSVVRENLMWMEGIMGQIGWDEPRYDTCHFLFLSFLCMKPELHLLSAIQGSAQSLRGCPYSLQTGINYCEESNRAAVPPAPNFT